MFRPANVDAPTRPLVCGQNPNGIDRVGVSRSKPTFDAGHKFFRIDVGLESNQSKVGKTFARRTGSFTETDIAEQYLSVGCQTGAELKIPDDPTAAIAEFNFDSVVFVAEFLAVLRA